MSNWIIIVEADMRTAKLAQVLEAVQAHAAALGDADPLPGYIADVTATLRTAIATANLVDVDPAKIPASLEGLAKRMIVRRLKDYLEVPLTDDEKTQAAEDRSYLNRIIDSKLKFEPPDDPVDSGISSGAGVEAVNVPARQTGRERTSGL